MASEADSGDVPFASSAGSSSSAAPSSSGPAPRASEGPATGPRQCPDCGKTYPADYADDFCTCGAELVAGGDAASSGPSIAGGTGDDDDALVLDASYAEDDSLAPSPAATTMAEASPSPPPGLFPTEPQKPAAGTVCLVVYSADRKPIRYHALTSDVTLIGRADPVRGDFPDLDLGGLFDEATAKSVSRKHALVLRSRQEGSYSLRPLAKNTGTQIEKELATELVDYPLVDGTRVILGGVVRLKFEIMK